jgi:hypothetical protein
MLVTEHFSQVPHINIMAAMAEDKMLLLFLREMINTGHIASNTTFIPLLP